MATITRENIAPLQDKITVLLAKEDYYNNFEKSLKNYAKTANVPGFRKGMVPVGMVKKMYGQSVFNEEIIRSASMELENYLKKEAIAIFAKPMLSVDATPLNMDMSQPTDCSFSFDIGIKPNFSIPAIDQKMPIKQYHIEVSADTIEKETANIQKRYGAPEDIEEVLNNENIVYAEFKSGDAEPVNETALLERYPEALQKLFIGKKANDTFSFVPNELLKDNELHGFLHNVIKNETAAAVPVKVTLTKAAKMILANLDENLFAQVFPNAEIKDEKAFKEQLASELTKELAGISKTRLDNEIYELLVHNTPMELPVNFLKRWLKEGQEKLKTDEEVEKEYPGFEHQLRWTLISDKVMVENKIEVSFDEVNADVKARVMQYFGAQNADDAPWLEGYLNKILKDEKTLNETYQRLLFDKLFHHLKGQMNLQEQKISEEEFMKLADPHATHHHH